MAAPEIHDRVPDNIWTLVNKRARTTEFLVHKIGPHGARTAAACAAFFLADPEGVATVTLSGKYADKVPIFNSWRRLGAIPQKNLERARVPYHFLVEPSGDIYQYLPLLAHGAHEPRSNGRAIAIACVGDYDYEEPSDEMLYSLRWLIKWLAFDDDNKRAAKQDQGLPLVRGHDQVLDVPKQCPGRFLLPEVVLLNDWLAGVQRQLATEARF